MFVITQRPIHVSTDKLVSVRQFDDSDPDDVEFYDTFVIEHECVGNGIFKVSVSPYSADAESIMCEKPSEFTVDYEALQEIYRNPSQFILTQVIGYDSRYELFDDSDTSVKQEDSSTTPSTTPSISDILGSLFIPHDDLPGGCNIVSYSNKDGVTTDIIIYSDDPKFVFTNEHKLKFDELYGVGAYKIMDTKSARLFIKQKEKELEKEDQEYRKNHPEEAKNWNPFIPRNKRK